MDFIKNARSFALSTSELKSFYIDIVGERKCRLIFNYVIEVVSDAESIFDSRNGQLDNAVLSFHDVYQITFDTAYALNSTLVAWDLNPYPALPDYYDFEMHLVGGQSNETCYTKVHIICKGIEINPS